MKRAIVHPSLSTLKEMTEDMKGRLVLIKSDGDEWEIIRDPFEGDLTEIEPTGDKVKIVCTTEDVVQKVHDYFFKQTPELDTIMNHLLNGRIDYGIIRLQIAGRKITKMISDCDINGKTVYVMDDGDIAYSITEDDAQFEYEGIKIYVAFIPENQ